jgi:hypothetical protein
LLTLENCLASCPLDFMLPDVSYQVESSEGNQSQNMDPQGPTLLLFLFVDFHSGLPVHREEIWGRYKGNSTLNLGVPNAKRIKSEQYV